VVTSGTANALSGDDLAVLSALTHHHGYAEATHLVHFADGAFSDSLDELSGRTAADFTELFTRAADAGFMQRAHASYFEVHPLLSLAIADALASERNLAHDARLARVFTELKGSEGESAYDEFETGKQRGRSLQWMASEERNFIHAWTLALHNQWWDLLRGPLFGLVRLYEVAGRATEWQQLTATTKSAIAGRPGCEKLDQELTLWEAKAAQEAGDLAKAGRLLRALLGRVPLSPSHARAVVLEALAEVERLADDPACIAHLQEALAFFAGRADHQDQARIHFNLAVAYERVSAIRDLGTALNQLKKSAELHNPRDGLGLGRCFSEVGQVHVLIAEKLEAEGGTASQIAKAQKAAWEASMVALSALPGAANDDRGVVLVRMGVLERGSGNPSAAVDLHTQALAAYTAAGAARGQGIARLQMAWDLVDLAQWSDALLYADAAAAQLGMLGAATATGAQQARDLAKEIRKVMAT
jgi:tetratricopeptide (TPR) repeat protein